MKTKKKTDSALLIGLGIPVVMIVVIAGVIGVFRLVHGISGPKTNFLYSVGSSREVQYSVKDGRLQRWTPKPGKAVAVTGSSFEFQFFIHHVRDNTSEEISFDRASALRLDRKTLSPDGFRLASGHRTGLFPICVPRDYRYRYLKKSGYAMKLDFDAAAGSGVPPNMTFLGWIRE
jgi:hypothetical protein